MDNDPEETARAKGEEIGKGEKPGKTELLWPPNRADDTKSEAEQDEERKHERQSGETIALEVFAFRRRDNVRALAHFLASSGFASGFVSAGLSSSARCSGGTSA